MRESGLAIDGQHSKRAFRYVGAGLVADGRWWGELKEAKRG
jgi:hypothetical protein